MKSLLKKVSVASLMLLVALASFVGSGVSAESNKDSSNKVKLKGLEISIPYKKSEVDLVQTEDADSARVEVYDKKTGEILTAYGVEEEQSDLDEFGKQSAIAYASGTTSIYRAYEEYDDGPVTTRLYTKMEVYSSGSFGQINNIISTYWQNISSSSATLEQTTADTISRTGGFPTTEVETNGDGVITVETTSSTTGSFSVDSLVGAGFEVSQTVGSTYYMRKPIYEGYVYSIYGGVQ